MGKADEEEVAHPTKAAGIVVSDILSFGETAERLLEVLMVVLVGLCLAFYWDTRGTLLALFLFFVIRPAAVFLFLIGTETNRLQRAMIAWFGIRGIGSLFYLSYALNHGLRGDHARDVIALTVSVVALSIAAHGLTVQPALAYYEKVIERRS